MTPTKYQTIIEIKTPKTLYTYNPLEFISSILQVLNIICNNNISDICATPLEKYVCFSMLSDESYIIMNKLTAISSSIIIATMGEGNCRNIRMQIYSSYALSLGVPCFNNRKFKQNKKSDTNHIGCPQVSHSTYFQIYRHPQLLHRCCESWFA